MENLRQHMLVTTTIKAHQLSRWFTEGLRRRRREVERAWDSALKSYRLMRHPEPDYPRWTMTIEPLTDDSEDESEDDEFLKAWVSRNNYKFSAHYT